MRAQALISLVLAVVLASCTATIAPSGWRKNLENSERTAFGAWTQVWTPDSGDAMELEGELIAVNADSIHVLTADGLQSMAVSEVSKLHLQWFDSNYGMPMTWTILGTASTISHGFILLVSAPVWILVGSVSASAQSKSGHERADSGKIRELSRYARFPIGFPRDLDRRLLKPLAVGFE